MRTSNNWTVESLKRALDVHAARGVVTHWSPPEAGRPRWIVRVKGQLVDMEWTGPQVYAFCVGCAEAWREARAEAAR